MPLPSSLARRDTYPCRRRGKADDRVKDGAGGHCAVTGRADATGTKAAPACAARLTCSSTVARPAALRRPRPPRAAPLRCVTGVLLTDRMMSPRCRPLLPASLDGSTAVIDHAARRRRRRRAGGRSPAVSGCTREAERAACRAGAAVIGRRRRRLPKPCVVAAAELLPRQLFLGRPLRRRPRSRVMALAVADQLDRDARADRLVGDDDRTASGRASRPGR